MITVDCRPLHPASSSATGQGLLPTSPSSVGVVSCIEGEGLESGQLHESSRLDDVRIPACDVVHAGCVGGK